MVKRSNKKIVAIFIVPYLIFSLILPIMLLDVPINNNRENRENIFTTIPKLKTSADEEGNLTREMFPLVISFANYPSASYLLHNKDYSTIRIGYYDSTEDEWHLVPFQIDEKGSSLVWDDKTGYIERAMNGPQPDLYPRTCYVPFGNGNGKYTHGGDELVFYAYNGDRAAIDNWNLPAFENRIEVKIVDPFDQGTSWMYIYYSLSSGGRPNSIEDESWYQEYISWNPILLEISTDMYQLNIAPNNYDIINNIVVKGTNNERNLITEFDKSFSGIQLEGNLPAPVTPEGIWDGIQYGYKGGVYWDQNPTTIVRAQDTALDDPSDPYDAEEGNLQYKPTVVDISGAGDKRPVSYGPCRITLMYHHYQLSRNGQALGFDAFGFIHSYSEVKFYYDRIEQDGGGNNAEMQMDPVSLTMHYEYNDIFSLNNDIRDEMMVHYGTETTIEECYPDGARNGLRGQDYYDVLGDPNYFQNPSIAKVGSPGNSDLANWILLTSENDGGFWRPLGGPERREALATQSTISAANMYWHDSASLTEMGVELEYGLMDEGFVVGSYTLPTIFGNFQNSDNQTGVALYELYKATEDNTVATFTNQERPNYPFFLSVEADELYYINGDTISLEIECDGDDYDLSADFSEIDSEYSMGDEIVENLLDNYYRINYTINATHNTITPGYCRVNITADDERPENNTKSIYIALYPSDFKFIEITSITSDASLIPGNTYYLIVNVSSLTNFGTSLTSLTLDKRYLNDKWGNAISNITTALPPGTLPKTLAGGLTSHVSLNYTMIVKSNAPPGLISINASCKFTVVVTDLSYTQNNATTPYSGVVLDNVLPKLSRPPGNLTLVDGSLPVDLIWTWFDYEPAYYNITRDGTTVKEGTAWSSNDPIIFRIDPSGLADNVYEYKISVNDTTGNSVWNSVYVTKTSAIDLAISNEYDVEFTYGDYVPDIRWIPSWDDVAVNPAAYKIDVFNGTDWYQVQSGGSWNQHGINLTIIDWWVGNYTVVCNISDSASTWVWDTVYVTVNNDIPEITNPEDLSYITGSSGNVINWTVSDDAFDETRYYEVTYRVYPNGPIFFLENGTWNPDEAFSVNIDGRNPSSETLYNYTIYVNDGLGGTVIDTVIVTVIPNDIPVVKNLGDLTVFEREQGVQIVWTLKDRYAINGKGSYEISIDGVLIYSGQYNASSERQIIIFELDDLAEPLKIGNYTFSITVNDGLGGIVTNDIALTVNEAVITRIKTIFEQLFEQYGFLIQYFFLGYVVYVIAHRRNYNLKKIRLKDPIYQSKKGITYERKFSRKELDKQDELILDGSIRQFKYASMIDPKLPEPHYNLAIALLEKGQINESIKEFRKVISLKPEFAEAHNNLGIALSLNGEFDEAITSFEEALKINPDFVEAKNNLETAKEDKDGEYWARFGVQ